MPAYHGHLHNNVVQWPLNWGCPWWVRRLCSSQSLPVLKKTVQARADRDFDRGFDRNEEFLCRAALLALFGFVDTGMFDYLMGTLSVSIC